MKSEKEEKANFRERPGDLRLYLSFGAPEIAKEHDRLLFIGLLHFFRNDAR